MKHMDIESMMYHMKPDSDDMWVLKCEHIFHEQQSGNYSFIVVENKRKNVKTDRFEELKCDTFVRE